MKKNNNQSVVKSKKIIEGSDSTWSMRYQDLKDYFETHQHSNIPARSEENRTLYTWVARQRFLYNRESLSEEKVELLNQLNFDWNPCETQWREMYQQLKDYFNQHGDCTIPTRYKENPQLANWISMQRQSYKKAKLSQEKIELLNQLNFEWDPFEKQWDEMYQQLKAYFESNGHMELPRSSEEERRLVIWARSQRRAYEQGRLSLDKIERLNKLNFDWSPLDAQWQEKYHQLKEYYKGQSKSKEVSPRQCDSSLEKWIQYQRSAYRTNKLSQERIKMLNELNFNWKPSKNRWDEMYQELKKYFEQHQHTNVPHRYEENPQLGNWVRMQRQGYKNGYLTQGRIDQLDDLNFDWDPLESQWKTMYQQLKEYFEQHNHSNVPQRYQNNKVLGTWVNNQRLAYKKNRLSQERIDLLNKLHFDWRE